MRKLQKFTQNINYFFLILFTEKNPSLETPIVRNELVIFGKKPPESACPPPPHCPECADPRLVFKFL